jgi:hypothetical protein
MKRYRYMLVVLIGLLLVSIAIRMWIVVRQRSAQCAAVPLLAENLLPNADLARGGQAGPLPQGWQAGAPGVQVGAFALDGDARSLQLMGIANYVQTPAIAVQPGRTYCFEGHAITDSDSERGTFVQVTFRWLDQAGNLLHTARSDWQSVVLWQAESPPESWSRIEAAFTAPPQSATLQVRVAPASDDRIYLDVMRVQQMLGVNDTTIRNAPQTPAESRQRADGDDSSASRCTLAPWPQGRRAAVSFSFDWETTMAGLIHSRSVGDPYVESDPLLRGMRMREGVTTTIALFRPYGVRATYYTAGYSLLMSNTNRIEFLGNPTYDWATTENRWTSNHWQTTPWFAPDPHGTVQSHPTWYFGDLVAPLQQAGHDIQSHTFSHFYGGFVQAQDWREDTQTWNRVAAWRDVPSVRSLAFPWSSSGGMSYASWEVLQAAGVTSVTRLSDQSQYNLFPQDEHGLVVMPRCRPLPGHERILACPDFYLTTSRVEQALAQVERAVQVEGMIDLWAHTEEVVSAEQQAAWKRVVDYVAEHPDIWVAPLREIADWQQAVRQVQIAESGRRANEEQQDMLQCKITNTSEHDLQDLTLRLAFAPGRVVIDGEQQTTEGTEDIVMDIAAGQTREVVVWRIQ